MLNKTIVRKTIHESTEYVPPIFIVKKPDGTTELIPNLKNLHEFVTYEHFKMDGIKTITNMVTKKLFHGNNGLKRCLLLCINQQIISEVSKMFMEG